MAEVQEQVKVVDTSTDAADAAPTVEALRSDMYKMDADAVVTAATTPLPKLDLVVDKSGSIIPRSEATANLEAKRP